MKIYTAIGILCFILIQVSCGTSKKDSEIGTDNQYSGIIEPAGITTYQYGTHTLRTESTFYALRSESIDLSSYENQEVTVSATEVEGYPLEGGPIYLEVQKIEK